VLVLSYINKDIALECASIVVNFSSWVMLFRKVELKELWCWKSGKVIADRGSFELECVLIAGVFDIRMGRVL
jgi:hypothetical protein